MEKIEGKQHWIILDKYDQHRSKSERNKEEHGSVKIATKQGQLL